MRVDNWITLKQLPTLTDISFSSYCKNTSFLSLIDLWWPRITWPLVWKYSPIPFATCPKISILSHIGTGSYCSFNIFGFWTITDLWWPLWAPKTIGHTFSIWRIYSPSLASIQHSLIEIERTQASVTDAHTHIHTYIHTHTPTWLHRFLLLKQGTKNSFLSGNIVFTVFKS